MGRSECPIWGTPCTMEWVTPSVLDIRSDDAGGYYEITDEAVRILSGWTPQEHPLRAKLSRWIYKKNKLGEPTRVDPGVLNQIKNEPMPSVMERIDCLLKFIESQERGAIGVAIQISIDMRVMTLASSDEELHYLLRQAREMDFIRRTGHPLVPATLTIKGYERLEELRGIQVLSDQAFVAMWFDESMDEAWEKGFKPGIKDAGYKPCRIDRMEHNNKIDDEIIAEVKRSRFLVADFTSELEKVRGGVYYEAGFAQGLNIPVIFTCRKDQIEVVHFDTRQFNHIVWDEAEDLRKKLKNRISATIGDGPHRNN